MRVGVPTEIKTDEFRVAITPAGVRELTTRATRCSCSRARAWAARSRTSTTPRRARASCPTPQEVWGEAELILKVKEPQPSEVGAAAPRADALHVPASGGGPRAHRGAVRIGRDVHRL